MLGRSDGWSVDEGSHGNVNKGAVAHQRIEERTAHLAVCVVAIFVAEDHEAVPALSDDQLVALYASERLEGGTSRPPAVRTMEVRGVDDFVRHGVADRAAIALSGKRAAAGFLRGCHGRLLRAVSGRSRAGSQLSSLNCNHRRDPEGKRLTQIVVSGGGGAQLSSAPG